MLVKDMVECLEGYDPDDWLNFYLVDEDGGVIRLNVSSFTYGGVMAEVEMEINKEWL